MWNECTLIFITLNYITLPYITLHYITAIYRGCFDGWIGGMVKQNYQGCKVQHYLGESVEWCFCKGYDSTPCNGVSRDAMIKMALIDKDGENIAIGPNTEDGASQQSVHDAKHVLKTSTTLEEPYVDRNEEIFADSETGKVILLLLLITGRVSSFLPTSEIKLPPHSSLSPYR